MQGLERDDAERLSYPTEPELNRLAMRAAIRLWRRSTVDDVRLMTEKLAYFWLSTDQLNGLGNFPYRVRLIRRAGVMFYWFSLVFAAVGMWKLFRKDTRLALTLLIYVSIATCLHLFFAMSTRLRAPLIDRLLCVLCSFPLLNNVSAKERTTQTRAAVAIEVRGMDQSRLASRRCKAERSHMSGLQDRR
jgi:hypothetical protein